MRNLAIGLAFLALGICPVARATRALTTSTLSDSDACKNRQTSFTAEGSSEYRMHQSNLDRGDRAQFFAERGNHQSLCGMSNRQRGSEDTAQAVVAADLLTRSKNLILSEVDRVKAGLQAKSACVNNSSCYDRQLQDDKSFVHNTYQQNRVMRAKLAISLVSPSCVASATSADRESNRRVLADCLKNTRLAHPRPFWDRVSNAVGLNESQFETNLQPLTSGEVNSLSNWIVDQVMTTGSPNRSTLFRGIKDQAGIQYQSMIIDNPMLRHLRTQNGDHAEFAAAFSKTMNDVTQARQQMERKPLRSFRQYGQAMQSALAQVPERFRGDYCEVGQHLAQEEVLLNQGRSYLLMLGSILPFGMVGRAAMAANGLMAAVNGGNFLSGYGKYRDRVRECVSAAVCTPQELDAASTVAELDYVSAGLVGTNAAGSALAKFLARTPGAAARVERMVAQEGSAAAGRKLEPVAATCLTKMDAFPNRAWVRYYVLLRVELAEASCNMDQLGRAVAATPAGLHPASAELTGTAAFRRMPDGQVGRVVGSTSEGRLVVEAVAGNRVERRVLSDAEESGLRASPVSEAQRSQYLMAEANARTAAPVAETMTVSYRQVNEGQRINSPALSTLDRYGPPGSGGLAGNPELPAASTSDYVRYQVSLTSSNGEVRNIPVYISNGFPEAERTLQMNRIAESIKGLPGDGVGAVRAIEIPSFDQLALDSSGRLARDGGRTRAGALAFAYGEGESGVITIHPEGFAATQNRVMSTSGAHTGNHLTHADELGDLLNHEYGHALARRLTNRQSGEPPGWAAIARADARSVSGYGNTNASEDFAESVRVYMASQGGRRDPAVLAAYENRFRYISQRLREMRDNP